MPRDVFHTDRSLFFKVCDCLFSTEIDRSYEMSSFVETKALELLKESPVEFVEYLLFVLRFCWLKTLSIQSVFLCLIKGVKALFILC